MGHVDWSPQLALGRACIALWTAMVKAHSGKTISSSLIRQLMAKAEYTSLHGITLIMAQTNLKMETHNYYQIKRQASTHRDTFLESLATAQAKEKEVDKSKHLKTLRLREHQRKTFHHIKAITKHSYYGGLTHVIDSDGKEYNTCKEIEEACLKENQAHFDPFYKNLYLPLSATTGRAKGRHRF